MAKYTEMAKGVLTNVGGIENITFVEHCATRLRIHYKSKSYSRHNISCNF